jgi:predicted RNA binding protein YcfA (HicA-like mRNA interferase family)
MLYPANVTAKQIMEILRANGWTLDRIKGSHYVFVKADCRPVSVPFHGNRDIGNLARRILKEAGIG